MDPEELPIAAVTENRPKPFEAEMSCQQNMTKHMFIQKKSHQENQVKGLEQSFAIASNLRSPVSDTVGPER